MSNVRTTWVFGASTVGLQIPTPQDRTQALINLGIKNTDQVMTGSVDSRPNRKPKVKRR